MKIEQDNLEMLDEYDFSGQEGVRGSYYRAYQQGHTVRIHHEDGSMTIEQFVPEAGAVVLAPDVRPYFPDAESVNEALRGLIRLIPEVI